MSLWWQNNPSLWLLWTVSIPTWVSINTLSCRLCSKWCQTFGGWCTYHQIILTGMDWLLCAFRNFSDHVFLIIREPGYWYQQPLRDYKKCRIAVCSSVAYGTHWDPQWQPDTTEVVITPLQQIHIDNRGQPACRSLMGLGWGCPIDWSSHSMSPDGTKPQPDQMLTIDLRYPNISLDNAWNNNDKHLFWRTLSHIPEVGLLMRHLFPKLLMFYLAWYQSPW